MRVRTPRSGAGRALALSLLSSVASPGPAAAQTISLDIPYVPGADSSRQLDLYTPSGAGFPTILYVHEGSLTSGDRKDAPYDRICRTFVSRGIGCALTSYRLFPTVDWPAPEVDVAAAFAWLHAHIAERGGAPGKLFVVGHSSGCSLASLLGSDPAFLAPHKLTPNDIAGVVAMGCLMDNRPPDTAKVDPARLARYFREDSWGARFRSWKALDEVRPMAHVGPQMAPYLVLLGDEERFKPPILEQGAAFVNLARDCRIDADIFVIPNRTHMEMMRHLVDAEDPAFRLIEGFIRRISEQGPQSYQSDFDRCPMRYRKP